MSDTEMVPILTPEQRRLLAPFVREYERARDHAAAVQAQASEAMRQADAARDEAGRRMLRAGALAVGGRADLSVDFDTWEVVEKPTGIIENDTQGG
jgi:hypothetical protein